MEESNNESFVKSTTVAIAGSINGVLLYDLVWPYLVIIILRLVLFNSYSILVEEHYYLMSTILMIATALITLGVALAIANPKRLIKAYHKIGGEQIKLIILTLVSMLAFSYFYNVFLLIIGVDITGGNANQGIVVNLLKESPILAFISMVIIAPISEEITYRYFLFGGIRKWNRKLAIVISGVIFMGVHAIASFTSDVDSIVRELLLLPPYLFSGMALAYAYDKSENLGVSTSIHILNNLISFILSFI